MAKNSPNYCTYGGALVSPKAVVPTDPTLFAPTGVRTKVMLGCSNLRCGRCDETVRDSPGRKVIGDTVDSEALYTAEDWGDGVLTTAHLNMGALYTCRCTTEWTDTYLYLFTDPRDSYDGVIRPPWSCRGHPVLTLPVEIDSVTIDGETDFDALVRRVLGGWSPPSELAPKQNEHWLALLYQRLKGLPEAQNLARAMGACLHHEDPYVRGGALRFFQRFPFAPGWAKAIQAAATSKDGELPYYATSGIPWSKRTEFTLVVSDVWEAHFDEVGTDDPRLGELRELVRAR